MEITTVKWFNPTLEYGFILDPKGGPDLLVRRSQLIGPWPRLPWKGDVVQFQRTSSPNKYGDVALRCMCIKMVDS